MTLGFSTHIDGEPNHFVEKIWNSLPDGDEWANLFYEYNTKMEMTGAYDFDIASAVAYFESKLHTIREDKSNRWKAGNKIHFVIHNRTPKRFQFAPVVECVSVQEFLIKYSPVIQRGEKELKKVLVWIDDNPGYDCLWVDGSIKWCDPMIERLAINDGFESVEDFFAYFNKDFTGKIIHWTKLEY